MVYILFGVLFTMYLLDRKRKMIVISGLYNPTEYTAKGYILFFVLLLLCISVLRADTIGVDTPSYLWSFLRGDYLSIGREALFSETEVGFSLLQKLCSVTGIGFRGLLVICGIITIIPIGIYISDNSENPFASFFFYICLDYYFFSMTGMRQSVAIGLCLISLIFVHKKKIIPFLLFVILACTIHKTAIVFLPVYFLAKVKIRRKHALFLLGIGAVLYAFKPFIRAFIRSFARIDYGTMETGGTGYYLLMIAIILVYLFLIDNDNCDDEFNLSVNMVIVAALLFPILQYNPTILRLHYYYSIALIALIPNTILRIVNNRVKFGISCLFFSVAIYYFIFYTSKNMGVLPYSLCF